MSQTTTTPPVAPSVPALDLKLIADLATSAAEVQRIAIDTQELADEGLPISVPVLWDPKAGRVIGLKEFVEPYRVHPREKRGTAKALTLASFIHLVNRHKTDASAVFADTNWKKPSFTAVIDYHPASSNDARNGKHRVGYEFPLSEEWQAWVKMDGQPMSQLDFAAFLEDRIRELASPTDAEKNVLEQDYQTKIATPSALMTLSRGLQINVESKVKDIRNLQSGAAAIQFEEVHKDADGRPLEIPGLFLLNIAPFFMGEPVRIPVRLRYRKSGGSLVWFFQMVRPDEYVTRRVRLDLDEVAERTTLPCFEASPEMPAA